MLVFLSGTISLCAGCDLYHLWAAVVVGALSGPLFLFSKWILLKQRIDDPLDAIPVHGAGGVWGVLAVYIFRYGLYEKEIPIVTKHLC